MSDISDSDDSNDSRSTSVYSSSSAEESSWEDEEEEEVAEIEDVITSSPSSSMEHENINSPIIENGAIDDTQPGVDVYTIDYKQMPSQEEVKRIYRRLRRNFAAKIKEKEILYDKIEDYKKQLDNLETFIPSAAAIWTTVDKMLKVLYTNTTPAIKDFPEANHEVFEHLLGTSNAKNLSEKLDDNVKVTKKMKEHLSLHLKAIFALLIPIAKKFFKEQFTDMVNNSPKLFASITGLTVDQILENDEIEEDQLGEKITKLGEEFRRCLDKNLTPNGVNSTVISTEGMANKLGKLVEIANIINPLLSNERHLEVWWSNYSKKEGNYDGEDIDSKTVKESLKKEDHLKALEEDTKDAEWETEVAERKQARIKRIIKQLRKEKLMCDQGTDEIGNKIVQVAQEDYDRLKEELIQVEKEKLELEDELTKLEEHNRELKRLEKIILEEQKLKDSEIEESPEMLIHKKKLSQIALDVKAFKKECQRLAEYEQYCNLIEKDIDETAKKEENELENVINQIQIEDNEFLEKLSVERKALEKELDLLPPFPETQEEFKRNVDNLMATFQNLKDKMIRNADINERTDQAIDEAEIKLESVTSNFNNHIRIEFDDPMIKNIELHATNLQQDDVDLILAVAEYNAIEDLEKISELPAEEQIEQCEALLTENSKGFFELLRMKQALTFLEFATPEEKRKFYTREAERRVRFTRHYLDRVKELLKHSKEACEVQAKSEEALGERYDLVQAWQIKIEDFARKQEEKNQVLFAENLQRLPMYKKRQVERLEAVAEVEEKELQAKMVYDQAVALDLEYDEMEKLYDYFREKLTQSVEQQSEVNELASEDIELDLLIEREERNIRNLKEKKQESEDTEHRLERRLRKAEKKLREAQEKFDEKVKVEKYGSYENMIKAETQRLKDCLTCSNCLQREKSAIITKCCHIFCLQCIENLVRARNRKCPKCKIGFGQNDYRKIYLGNS
uniref:E3 ubiquitin protein ligase n=1 Tax=Panagrolaimus superbus TaxID=310955 RepID=A0A914YX96_9BILA